MAEKTVVQKNTGLQDQVVDYFKNCFTFDLRAGFITAVVALPLAIAFAIASGVSPIMGLYTAVIAGFLGSLFGGSVYSITGPTGAMTVVVLSTLNKFGLEGLMLAGFLAGVFQFSLGAIKLGKLIKFIPVPIVSGFTAGIGIIIFIGQIPSALGLSLGAKEHVWETIFAVIEGLGSINHYAVLIALGTYLILRFGPKIFSRIRSLKSVPPSIIALLLFTSIVYFNNTPVPQIGEIPPGLPSFSLIKFDFILLQNILPAALTIALLGVIESLLCAVVCDGMTNTRHDSDRELLAQGICNITLPFFGGIPATGAIARSAVNIREGAKTRFAGVIHALFILLIILFLAPEARYIPSAFLAGVLMTVSIRMINLQEIKTILKISRAETTVLFITLGLTVLTDLVFAVQAGMILAVGLIFIKLSKLVDISGMEEYDEHAGINERIYSDPLLRDKVAVYTLHGPLFFGAMNLFDQKVSEHIDNKKQILILRMKHVPLIDSTAITRLNTFIHSRHQQGYTIYITGLNSEVKRRLHNDEEFIYLMKQHHIFHHTNEALDHIKKELQK
jgi:SulP family sulfate permease